MTFVDSFNQCVSSAEAIRVCAYIKYIWIHISKVRVAVCVAEKHTATHTATQTATHMDTYLQSQLSLYTIIVTNFSTF